MAITFNATGAIATAQTGNVTPGLPAGFAADDIHVCVVGTADNGNVTFPAGWTKKIELNNGTLERITIAWRRAVGGDAAPLVSHGAAPSNEIAAQIVGFRGAVTSGDPFDAFGSQANASSVTITAPAITPVNANDMILFVGTTINGNSLATVSGYSGTNPTFTEAIDGGIGGTNNNTEICLAYGIKTDVTSTGTRTATATEAGLNIGALLSMQEAAVAAFPPPFKRRQSPLIGM